MTQEDKINLEAFKKILQQQGNIPPQFRLDRYPEQAEKLLLECYKQIVSERNGTIIEDEFTKQHIKKAAKWLVQGKKTGLMIYGPVGNGKTTLMRAIIKLINILYYNEKNTQGHFVSALKLAEIAKNNQDHFSNIKNVSMLYIDDLGCEPAEVKNYGNTINPVTELIFARYDSQKFTIATSNLTKEAFSTMYGERAADRLNEMFDFYAFNNKSYRK